VGQMLRQVWGLCGKIICTKAVLLIIRICIIWINLRNERSCYIIYWTALVLFRISEGKRLLGRPSYKLEDNIQMSFKETGCRRTDRAQDRD
jgi:hypothetical protein